MKVPCGQGDGQLIIMLRWDDGGRSEHNIGTPAKVRHSWTSSGHLRGIQMESEDARAICRVGHKWTP